MTTDQRTALIAAAVARRAALDTAFAPIIAVFKNHDFPAYVETWRTFDAYLATLAREIGDQGGWLHWFIWDNDCGRKALEVIHPGWRRPHRVRTPRQLARLLEVDFTPPAC